VCYLGSAAFHLDLLLAVGAVGTVGKRGLFFHGFHSPDFCLEQPFPVDKGSPNLLAFVVDTRS